MHCYIQSYSRLLRLKKINRRDITKRKEKKRKEKKRKEKKAKKKKKISNEKSVEKSKIDLVAKNYFSSFRRNEINENKSE